MILTTLIAACLCADAAPTSWPGFRGDGLSVSTAKNLPLKWSPTERRAWVTPLPGYGQSSPVVWGDRAFVTSIDGNEKEKLFVGGGACAINCTNQWEIYSMHTGGANCLFADGSVRFLGESLTYPVLAAMITRAGGEIVDGGN